MLPFYTECECGTCRFNIYLSGFHRCLRCYLVLHIEVAVLEDLLASDGFQLYA